PVVHQASQLREVLADLDAGDAGLNGLVGAALLGAGTQVEGVLVAGTAIHPQEDAGLGASPSLGSAGGQDIHPTGHRGAKHASGGQLEHVAAGQVRVEHDSLLRWVWDSVPWQSDSSYWVIEQRGGEKVSDYFRRNCGPRSREARSLSQLLVVEG